MLANSKVKRVTNGNEFEDFGFSDGLLGDLNDFFSNKNFGNGDFGTTGDNGNGNSDLVLQDDLECETVRGKSSSAPTPTIIYASICQGFNFKISSH